tara:strand:+ start:56092 stop:56988 length:897 start_codon:yes stop_codon:yes gene_type:complete
MDEEKIKELKIVKKLGHGVYGHVFLIEDQNKKRKIAKVCRKKDARWLQREISVLKTISHKNIITYYDTFYTKMEGIPSHFSDCFFTAEFIEGCNCSQYLIKLDYIPDEILWGFIENISDALIYLKNEEIIHRDIKLQNIMKTESGFKLIDFGFAYKISDEISFTTSYGTPLYLAPEIISGLNYTYASDIWAFGVTIYNMVTKNQPFDSRDIVSLKRKILLGKYEKLIGPFGNLIERIFLQNPFERITSIQIKEIAKENLNGLLNPDLTDLFLIPELKIVNDFPLENNPILDNCDEILT